MKQLDGPPAAPFVFHKCFKGLVQHFEDQVCLPACEVLNNKTVTTLAIKL